MSHFYSRIEGSGGPATRCGTKASGVGATVRTWSGDLHVALAHREHGAKPFDETSIALRPEHGHTVELGYFDHSAVLTAIAAGDKRTQQAVANLQQAFGRLDMAGTAHASRKSCNPTQGKRTAEQKAQTQQRRKARALKYAPTTNRKAS